jgi:hypothetical protein
MPHLGIGRRDGSVARWTLSDAEDLPLLIALHVVLDDLVEEGDRVSLVVLRLFDLILVGLIRTG